MHTPLGEINILFGFAKLKDAGGSGKKNLFEIVAQDRTYLFSCDTAEELNGWVNTIQKSNQTLMNAILRNTIEERRKSILCVLQNDFSEMENIARKNHQWLKEILLRSENCFCADCSAPGICLSL